MFRLRSGRFCGLRFALLLAEQLAFHVSAVTTAEGCDLDPGSRRVQESRVRNRNVVLASRVGSKSDDGLALKTRLVPHRGYIAKLNALDRWWEDASRDDRGRKSL